LTVNLRVDSVGDVPDPSYDVVAPALLRHARGAYAHAVRTRLADGEFDDLPRNGPFVLGGMANHGIPASDVVKHLGVSKQATSQLIDTLVVRGYLERSIDPDDRRRITIEVTDRGRAAAKAVRAGVEAVDAELAAALSPAQLEGFRAGLDALCAIRERLEAG
jgi:DNA-binding MarR family transcriptional regulator